MPYLSAKLQNWSEVITFYLNNALFILAQKITNSFYYKSYYFVQTNTFIV